MIYEPAWNGPGATSPDGPSTNPALDTWTSVTIDENNGLFWWTGGFGQPNSGGGAPVRWYRYPQAIGAGFNLTNALEVVFCP